MRTIKLTIEYDGTHLSGWQRQRNAPTVQQHVEDALARMVQAPVHVQGASRTDAGVHALAQVAHFVTASTIPLHGFQRGINSHLPPSIAILACEHAPDEFHARFSARGKHYRYTLHGRPTRSPLMRDRAWHRPGGLDLPAMRAAAVHILGERDFAALRAAGCTARTTVRHVTSIDISQPDPDLVHLDVRGNAFLRNMVRIIAGTLVAVGESRLTPADVAAIVDSRDRTRAGPTAPAHGLTLVQVFYDSAP